MMKIEVTEKDIELGRTLSRVGNYSNTCAVARAVKRALGTKEVRVGPEAVEICGVDYNLPPETKEFISKFDRLVAVEPFTFELPVNRKP